MDGGAGGSTNHPCTFAQPTRASLNSENPSIYWPALLKPRLVYQREPRSRGFMTRF